MDVSEPKINWKKAVASNHLTDYQSAVDEAVRPLIGKAYTNIESEIAEFTHRLTKAALRYLLKCKEEKHLSNSV